jgi:hypothetical protein
MNTFIKITIWIICYGLSFYLFYRLHEKYHKQIVFYFKETISYWFKFPNWMNWGLGFFLFFGCIFLQKEIFPQSFVLWLILLFIAPIIYRPIRNRKVFNIISVTIFFITTFYAILLFFLVDNARNLIGETLISGYKVHHTTEFIQNDFGDYDEIEVTNANTGNDILDFALEAIFPIAFRVIIGLMVLYSAIINISLNEKNKLTKT